TCACVLWAYAGTLISATKRAAKPRTVLKTALEIGVFTIAVNVVMEEIAHSVAKAAESLELQFQENRGIALTVKGNEAPRDEPHPPAAGVILYARHRLQSLIVEHRI